MDEDRTICHHPQASATASYLIWLCQILFVVVSYGENHEPLGGFWLMPCPGELHLPQRQQHGVTGRDEVVDGDDLTGIARIVVAP